MTAALHTFFASWTYRCPSFVKRRVAAVNPRTFPERSSAVFMSCPEHVSQPWPIASSHSLLITTEIEAVRPLREMPRPYVSELPAMNPGFRCDPANDRSEPEMAFNADSECFAPISRLKAASTTSHLVVPYRTTRDGSEIALLAAPTEIAFDTTRLDRDRLSKPILIRASPSRRRAGEIHLFRGPNLCDGNSSLFQSGIHITDRESLAVRTVVKIAPCHAPADLHPHNSLHHGGK